MERGIVEEIDEVMVNGHPLKRLFNTLSIRMRYAEGESILTALELEGIAPSGGSACSAGSSEPSHVLLATGISPDTARGSLRFSLGRG